MDWIEQLFGVSPDGGDGGLERLIAVAAALVLVALASRLPAVRTALVRLLGCSAAGDGRFPILARIAPGSAPRLPPVSRTQAD
jgi:hypothetical protein